MRGCVLCVLIDILFFSKNKYQHSLGFTAGEKFYVAYLWKDQLASSCRF